MSVYFNFSHLWDFIYFLKEFFMRKNFLISLGVMSFIALFSVVNVYAALNGYLKLESKGRGTVTIVKCMNGSCPVEGVSAGEYMISLCDAQGKSVVAGSTPLNLSYEVKSPRDAASGLATGRRMHKPITFTKEWDRTASKNIITITDNGSSITFKTMASDDWTSPSTK